MKHIFWNEEPLFGSALFTDQLHFITSLYNIIINVVIIHMTDECSLHILNNVLRFLLMVLHVTSNYLLITSNVTNYAEKPHPLHTHRKHLVSMSEHFFYLLIKL